jgi:hypothetical protein
LPHQTASTFNLLPKKPNRAPVIPVFWLLIFFCSCIFKVRLFSKNLDFWISEIESK